MKSIIDFAESNDVLQRFRIRIEVYDCLEKDKYKSYSKKEEYKLNDTVKDQSLIISIYKDWTRYASYDTKIYSNDFPVKANHYRLVSKEQRIMEALDFFQGYSNM